ncbi:hypothetical protein KRP22_011372 [Phytophthora ramorum]|uniref:uncharacterized protein n=1 Tax=Phytophthora ramorum TaxID=164328 RepID=UPI0030B788A9|nr:hypothetical protein KRP23_3173 [Phytophthora ramorum]KAH7499959.1 hypothetical protein KRP22_10573 [Phytophthora ramorum]
MPSPGKVLQLQTVYLTSPGKLQALDTVASPPRKRKPAPRNPRLSGLSPVPDRLSPQQWKQWMHEAQELNASASVFLATTSSESLAQAANEGLQLVLNPELARTDERLTTLIDAHATALPSPMTGTFTMKYSPTADTTQQWRWHVTKPKKRKKTANLSIEPLLSDEMRTKLQAHLEEKIKGSIWENEIRSRLARPLSASTFCSRNEQLRHPLAAAQFASTTPDQTTESEPPKALGPRQTSELPRPPRFPFSMEAHESVNCIRRCRNVAVWVRQALELAAARVVIARLLTALYLARRARWEEAARRAAHLRRWVAKTRVSLFVHQTWTDCWFRRKRVVNVDGMKQELAALEASDHDVSLQYTAIFASPLAKGMVKKELALWRIGTQKRTSQEATPSSLVNLTSIKTDEEPAIVRLRQCFQIFDLDGSGTLDLDEFQLLLSYLRGKKQTQPNRGSVSGNRPTQQPPKLTQAQTRSLFAELDCDGNGGITCGEFESWWQREHGRATLSTSASTNFLSRGLDGLLLQSHGLLFWLLGRKQQLERKFVKKLMVRRATESARREILHREIDRERVAGLFSGVFRCGSCGRRFGLRRDLIDHIGHDCSSNELVADTFTLKRWVREEEFRLLQDVKSGV